MRLSERDRYILGAAIAYAVIASGWFIVASSIESLFSSRDIVFAINMALNICFVVITSALLVAVLRRTPVAIPELAPRRARLIHLLGYPFAVAATLAMLWVRLSIGATLGSQPALILFVIPIALSAYLGGFGSGLVATATATLVTNYFLLPPTHSFRIESPLAGLQWAVLIGTGTLLSVAFEALRRSRRQIDKIGALQAAIVSTSEDAIISNDLDGIVTSWNRGAESIYGYSAAEMVGRPISILSVPGEEHVIGEMFSACVKGETVRQSRGRRRRKDGSIADVSVMATPLTDAEGRIVGVSGIARDIGELLRAEVAREKLMEQMHTFVEQAPMMIAMLDRDMNYLAASQLLTDRLMAARQDGKHTSLIGLNHYELVPYLPDKLKDSNRRALAGETINDEEERWVMADGSTRWLRSTVRPWTDSEGNIGGIIVASDDYTERKQVEDALRESEQRFAAIFRDSPVGIAIADLSSRGEFVEVNPAWLRISGFRREEVLGQTTTDINLWVDPADRDTALQNLSKPSGNFSSEVRLRRKDGSIVDIAMTMRQVDIDGHRCAIAVGYDISDRKRLERELRRTSNQLAAFIEASPVAIIGVDPDDSVVTWNRAAAEIFGFSSEEALGKPFLELAPVPPEDGPILRERSERRRRGEITRSLPSRRRRKDGSWASLTVSAADLRDANGELSGTILVMEDITEREKLEHQLIQAQKMESIGQLTGGVAHDFNNLLTVILGSLEMIRDQIGHDEAVRPWIAAAVNAGKSGADLTHRLLAFSRRQALEPRATDVNMRIGKFVPLLTRMLGEAIEVRLRLTESIWPAMIDPSQLESAILNLAVNSRDAMPEGGWIEIATDNVTVDEAYAAQNVDLVAGDFVRVTISDSGQGMPPEVLARAFEPFFTTKELGKGTGLGLAMVYGFIKQSGGNATIYSEAGKGTVVRLLLPRAPHDAVVALDTTVTHGGATDGGESVLVVEDDDLVRSVTVAFLNSLGYRTIDVGAGYEALTILKDHPEVALLLTDVVLAGGETGTGLAEEAKRIRPSLGILFASGYTEEGLVHSGQLDANVLLLHKPFTKGALAMKVREALDRARKYRE